MTTAHPADLSVYIGRFQPLHSGHLALLHTALAIAPQCVVVLGSAHQARTPKNPFTWQERADMIRLALPEADRARVHFLPIRDHYHHAKWVAAVRAGVAAIAPSGAANITLIGHLKDASSDYLHHFPGWRMHAMPRVHHADGTHLRDALFGQAGQALEPALAAIASYAPPSTVDFLRAWSALPHFAALAQEWAMLKHYHRSWVSAPYPPVFVTVDAVVCCAGHVLLIRRAAAPGKGLLALPGGFIEPRETLYQSALRELKEETHLHLLDATMQHSLKAVVVFDHPDRSRCGRTITHAHHFDLGQRELPELQAADDALSAQWLPAAELCALESQFHDDHFHILNHFLKLT
jgi:bifunctional NMN adenylyltransferase/nudix hydrolase